MVKNTSENMKDHIFELCIAAMIYHNSSGGSPDLLFHRKLSVRNFDFSPFLHK